MFSMAVFAPRKTRFAAASALTATLALGAGTAVTVAAAPAAQAAVSHSAVISANSGSSAGNAALNWAESMRDRPLVLIRRDQLLPGLRLLGPGHGGLRPRRRGFAAALTYAMVGSPRLHRYRRRKPGAAT